MIQAVMMAPGKIIFRHIELPELGEGQVLIKTKRIGICGSDIHVYHGRHPYTTYPVVQGHEVSGEIVKTVGEVNGLKVGDKVTVRPQVVCGKCRQCSDGNYNICDELKVMGFQTTGTASEYFAVDHDKILRLPEKLSFDEGAMIEPLAVAVHALGRAGDIKNKNVLVLGAGPIGNLVAQTAKGLGADTVMITDLSDFRLEKAWECGIDFCINTVKEDLEKAVRKSFGPGKADLVLECAGAAATMDQAVNCARKGTNIIAVGVFGEKTNIDLGLVQDRELSIIGTLMYKQCDYERAVDLLTAGKIKLQPIITDHYGFNDYIKAYERIVNQKDKVMKVLIDVHE